ncbi:MAG: stage II sporulation protein R [Bacilli bacterium]
MKKVYFLIIISVLGFIYFMPQDKEYVIPKESIRFRVISNSNSPEDIVTKNKVRDNVQKELVNILQGTSDIDTAKKILRENIQKVDSIVKKTLNNNDYNVNLGLNYFPVKTYRDVKYEEGLYESLVITIKEGKGNNWWCVLFPPLCLLEAEESNTGEVEYKFFVKEIINKYLKK